MSLEATYKAHKLKFRFKAGTSRGILTEKQTYFLKIWDSDQPEIFGVGEAGPLAGLSPDYGSDFSVHLRELCVKIKGQPAPGTFDEITDMATELVPLTLPALRFATEAALLELLQGGKGVFFPGAFTESRLTIPINGLIWMGNRDFMRDQIDQKVLAGYRCIKLKIGALNFEEECGVLQYIREQYGWDLVLRVDANGAFKPPNVQHKLMQLARFKLHSIEQPLAIGQQPIMRELCLATPVPIALDEELIGVTELQQKKQLLENIRPQFIVLKPTLLGGLKATREWIDLANEQGIGWWITSALESNIGLNAIAQFTATLNNEEYQGLGTGQLFKNNLPTRLFIKDGQLCYRG